MKLASLRTNSRDGKLLVVSRDLTRAVAASEIAPTLQAALDDWAAKGPKLSQLSALLNTRRAADAFDFDPNRCEAPLPRAYHRVSAAAYPSHRVLMREAYGAAAPDPIAGDPAACMRPSDAFAGPCDPIAAESEALCIDFGAEVAVVTVDVPMGIDVQRARDRIALIMLCNDPALRGPVPGAQTPGDHAEPGTAFSPVAVTPDELGDAWDGCKVTLPIIVHINGTLFGQPEAGEDLAFDFPQLIAHCARSRRLGAGTIVSAGPVSNAGGRGGYACIAERRAHEMVERGRAITPFLRFGDRIRIEMRDAGGNSMFGAIDQDVQRWNPSS